MSSPKISVTPLQPHIALLPGAEIGHLTPFLRLASMLLSHNCLVTLITAKPTVSLAESMNISLFLSTHPEVKHVEFQVLPSGPRNTTDDPFLMQFKAINSSAHLLTPLLSALSPPPSAIFSDFTVASGASQIAVDLGIPHYVVATTSAKFFSLLEYLSTLISDPTKFSSLQTEIDIVIPGLTPLPVSSIPPIIFNPNHLFKSIFLKNVRALPEVKGILLNTFDWFEPEALAALNNDKAIGNLPPVLPIGPLVHHKLEGERSQYLQWLDNQPTESVLYISFGSRTTMLKDQMAELEDALDRNEHRFLWVVKSRIVDYDDKENLEDLLSSSFLERTKNRGMIVKGWVKQHEILAHPAIGGFISHCGWNSTMEAAQRGIPVLAWPLGGDQRVNADVLEKAGLGTWERSWGWTGQKLVKQDEIQRKIDALMKDEKLRSTAKKVGEEARKAGTNTGGSSKKVIMEVIEFLKQNMTS